MSVEDLFSDYLMHSNNTVTTFGQYDKEKKEIINEVEARLRERDIKIQNLQRQLDKHLSHRLGEGW